MSAIIRLFSTALMFVLAQQVVAAPGVDHRRIVDADGEPGNWLSHGRTYDEQRYSPLQLINSGNVEQLGLAWSFDVNSNRGLEATPIVVDGVMFVSGVWNIVYALDAATGALLWEYDPRVPRNIARKLCCDAVNRGVAVWGDKVYIGTLDGRLVALYAADGTLAWETMTVDPEQAYSITGAPRIVKGLVIIGNGGAEFGVRGYVDAYAAETGERAWRFYTVPANPADGCENEALAMAADTWNGEWWRLGGGGTVWDSLAYDPELDLLYLGVGNGSPWNRRLRSPGGGDNLFLSSIVALRPKTGEYVWHYQVVPAETWDYTATQHMILADIEWQGEIRRVLMQAPKSGFFMIIDRVTGEFLSAEPFVEVTWASHYDPDTGRPVENPGQDYAGGSALVKPASGGAHNFQPMAYHPGTGLVYIPIMETGFKYIDRTELPYERWLRQTGVVQWETPPGDELFLKLISEKVASGHLQAWNPRTQSEAWRVDYSSIWNSGVLATAGNLVFHGSGNRFFRAYLADSGEQLWEFPTQTGVIAAPATYTVNGEQYVTILAGWGGAFGLNSGVKPPPGPKRSRVLTFKLGGRQQL
ncbi:MAG: PQQ-dependent dehydrogenase, methanol/ethanol family, partial [Gammaproteobacteria bacterium]|nr:PQQ-dependent dehydrogenase, methanol/ethanol family [Gammaproteobacteria bacterium]